MRKLALLFLALSLALGASDISGVWDFTVETAQGSGNPKFTFQQNGEKLTGTYEGMFGKANVKGTVKGDAIEFSIDISAGGQTGKITYKGTIESPVRMKGEVEMPAVGKGTWTAAKK